MGFLTKILGDPEKRALDKLKPLLDRVNALEKDVKKLKDEDFPARTAELKKRLQKEENLDDILPEAFSLVREAARRTIKERPFDVQVLGGIVLHQGKIAEMKTGEGKTLAATMPVYLNALTGKGVHIVTVNDYLARRDTNWMGAIYHFLGLKVACIQHEKSFLYVPTVTPDQNEVSIEMENLKEISRKEAYLADITYGTNNEFGFDYLRDNMVADLDQMVQRELNFAIVDEVDSILIDEARTPLIISAPDLESTKMYSQFASIVPQLEKGKDYTVDEKMKAVALTDRGMDRVEKMLGIKNIYEERGIARVHHLEQALRAHALFNRDRDYVVKDGQVIIVDAFTGRLMPGRRFGEGLHQAIEAKEGVNIQQESKTLATITFQNYFRLYKKLAGMTGTALTSAEEFDKVYKLDVVVIPTNKPMIRKDLPDKVYKTEEGKFKAIVAEIKKRHKKGQPVLVGTIAIEKSELLSAYLKREGIPHEVLNAKHHEKEAHIVAKAGQRGAVTIATNMAGRGTDIKLGKGVTDLGGLHIIGTERHEARRIDNQLRGRSGRQGDPGSSQFFLSMDDDVMRVFGGERLRNLMTALKIPEDQPIENKIVSRSIEKAQSQVEGYYFDARKHVLEYDDVMNKQREVIYKKRREILEVAKKKPEKLREIVKENAKGAFKKVIGFHLQNEEWEPEELFKALKNLLPLSGENLKKIKEIKKGGGDQKKKLLSYLLETFDKNYREREEKFKEKMREIEKAVLLRTIDNLWMEHLDTMDYLRTGIGLRGYGQEDPLVAYKKEAFKMFEKLLGNIELNTTATILRVEMIAPARSPLESREAKYQGADLASAGADARSAPVTKKKKIGRNDPCPCGSGKKYKKCCGR